MHLSRPITVRPDLAAAFGCLQWWPALPPLALAAAWLCSPGCRIAGATVCAATFVAALHRWLLCREERAFSNVDMAYGHASAGNPARTGTGCTAAPTSNGRAGQTPAKTGALATSAGFGYQ